MSSAIPLPLSCPDCAARMPETAAFCPGCGRPMPKAAKAEADAEAETNRRPVSENFAAALAYFTFVPAILFLAIDPYKKNEFVRYHAVQCLLVWVVATVATIGLKLVGLVLLLIPVAGPLLIVLIWVTLVLAALLLWLILVVKAFQGEMFQVPVLGAIAERYARVIQP